MTEIEILSKKIELIEKILEALRQMVFTQQTQIDNHTKSFQVIAGLLRKMDGIGEVDLEGEPEDEKGES